MRCVSRPCLSVRSHAGRALKPRAPETGTSLRGNGVWSLAGAAEVQVDCQKPAFALGPVSCKGSKRARRMTFPGCGVDSPPRALVHTAVPRDAERQGPGSPWGVHSKVEMRAASGTAPGGGSPSSSPPSAPGPPVAWSCPRGFREGEGGRGCFRGWRGFYLSPMLVANSCLPPSSCNAWG